MDQKTFFRRRLCLDTRHQFPPHPLRRQPFRAPLRIFLFGRVLSFGGGDRNAQKRAPTTTLTLPFAERAVLF